MKTIHYQNADYYVDGAKPQDDQYKAFSKRGRAVEDVDYFHAVRKINFFNPSKLTGGYDDLAWINSFFSYITQPTEADVRRALLMVKTVNTGDGAMHKYSLKSGGGSGSDQIYSSSLSVVVAHPNSGEDTWIVLLKKYSTTFSDILITFQELADLYELCSTETQKTQRNLEYAQDVVGYLVGSVTSGFFRYSNTPPIKCTPEATTDFIQKVKKKATTPQWEAAFNSFRNRIEESQKIVFEEKPGRDVNAEHQVTCLKKLSVLSQLHKQFFALPKALQPEPPQLTLFAA